MEKKKLLSWSNKKMVGDLGRTVLVIHTHTWKIGKITDP